MHVSMSVILSGKVAAFKGQVRVLWSHTHLHAPLRFAECCCALQQACLRLVGLLLGLLHAD